MENQHRKISGYRELTQPEIDLMNEIKEKGEDLKKLIQKVNQHINNQHAIASAPASTDAEFERMEEADPCKWSAYGEHQLQLGIMALVRAIAQPTTF